MAELNTWYTQSNIDRGTLLHQLDIRTKFGSENRLTITIPKFEKDISVVASYRDAEVWTDVKEVKVTLVKEEFGKKS